MGTRIMGMRFAAAGLLLCAMAMEAHAATITVTNTNDSGPGSLRQALAVANDGDTITFAVTGTIGLTSGGLLVARNVTISGPGANQLSVDGNQALLVFGIFPGKTAAISGLTIRNGQLGIWNHQATLTVSNCVVSGNSAVGIYSDHGTLIVSDCDVSGNRNGGIYNDHGTVTVSNCVVNGNSPFGLGNNGSLGPPPPNGRSFGLVALTISNSIISNNSGPGVDNGSGTITIVSSTLTGNDNPAGQDSGYGGGIYAHYAGKLPPSTTIINSTISGNSAFYGGGGIAAGGYLMIVNSTISGNSAGDSGGGIYNYGHPAVIANATLSGNSASSGGGIYNSSQNGALEISNTILNAGASGENIFNNGGMVTSHGYNVSSDNGGGYLTGPGDQINTNPLLGPLQNNGGPTLTHAPLPGSPAIDAGDPNFTPPPFYDQRGQPFVRVFHGRVDIGSVETQPQRRPRPTPAPRPTPH